MVEVEYLRLTVIWSVEGSEVSYAFANGEVVEALNHAPAGLLEEYLAGLSGQGWGRLTAVQTRRGIETYYFKRTVGPSL